MNTKQENVLMDSCQFTPVYLVENTGAIQGRSFILTQPNVEEPKPVSDNLKRYYENSGIVETSFVNNGPTFSKPRILKRQERLVKSNLKVAGYLLPKSSSQEFCVSRQTTSVNTVQTTPVNNVQTTPVYNVQTTPVHNVQTTPVHNVQTKPVNNVQTKPVNNIQTKPVNSVQTTPVNNVQTKPVNNVYTTPVNNVYTTPVNTVHTTPVHNVQTIPVNNIQTTPLNNVVYKPVVTTSVVHTVPKVEVERKIVRLKNFPSKLKPTIRERIPPKIKPKENPPNPNPIKYSSVQLLKLGETYHSLNQLSDDQMKMVNQALKIFTNPKNESMEPTYDPVTNTRFIYKVVSPRDLTVVGKNKLKRDVIRKGVIVKELKREPKKSKEEVMEPEPPATVAGEVKITRSGRKVKFPKQVDEESHIQQKPKKRNGAVISCFQCSTEFCSLYRLQKHYENHPTHIPAKIHSNLFYCLLAIIKSGSEEDKTTIFIQQLEQLIEKLKSLLPCLLKKIDGVEGKPCTINDNVGRLFGMNPGKYKLNMDGLTCVKNKDGNCRHNPPPPKCNFNLDLNLLQPSPLCHTIQHEESTNENETEDCARINAVDKWPIANKRFRNIKQQKTLEINAKRMKLASESNDTMLELDDFVISNTDFTIPIEQSAINVQAEAISLLDSFIHQENKNSVQQPVVVEADTQNSTTVTDLPAVIDKRPTPNRKLRNIKPQKQQEINTKKIKQTSDNTERTIDVDDFVICNGNFSIPMEDNADNVRSETISLLDNFIDKESDNCIQQPVVVMKDTQKNTVISDLPKKAKGAHTQFHSAHFDIRSSPIKTSSAATFHKFQINPEKLAKYEVQIIRPLKLDKDSNEVNTNSKADMTHNFEAEVIQNEEGIIDDSAIPSNPDNSVLQSIFRDDLIELTCKDPNDIPNDLAFAAAKEWISSGLNSVDGKSNEDFIKTNSLDESFIRGSSLLEPALLHCKVESHDKLLLGSEMTADHLSGNDNHILNQNSASVLNFLDSLGSECLSYPETEIRNNNVDFQLDLFSFGNT